MRTFLRRLALALTLLTPAAAHAAPTVDAGQDQTITNPVSSVVLDGIVTDATSVTWSQESLIGNTVFVDTNSAQTVATFTYLKERRGQGSGPAFGQAAKQAGA